MTFPISLQAYVIGKFFSNHSSPVKVISVYDGDTITVEAQDVDGIYVKFPVRLAQIDCPELRGTRTHHSSCSSSSSLDFSANHKMVCEIEVAKIAKQFLSDLLLNKIVHLENVTMHDKYGRLLANIILPGSGQDVGKILIEKRLAVVCDKHGTKKNTPANWLEFYQNQN